MTLHKEGDKNNMSSKDSKPVQNGEDVPQPGDAGSSKTPSGGRRKQLPSIPDAETQLSLNKMADRKSGSPRGNHSYGPFLLEYALMAEYNMLQKQKLPGVYVIPAAKSPLLWHGMLFIRQGLYQEGAFRFSLYIQENYPDGDCPRVVFQPPIFHPVVNPETGELDVKRAFQKWRRNVNHLWQVLLYTRRVFYKIDTKSPLNPEAAVLYEKDVDLYKSRVYESIQNAKDKLYDSPMSEDPHAIRFDKWTPEVHEEARKTMLNSKVNTPGGEPM